MRAANSLTDWDNLRPDGTPYRKRKQLGIDQQIAELKAAGWKAKTPMIWASPSGKLYLGPHGAWKAMRKRTDPPQAPTPDNPHSL